jgi:hypothetical protein
MALVERHRVAGSEGDQLGELLLIRVFATVPDGRMLSYDGGNMTDPLGQVPDRPLLGELVSPAGTSIASRATLVGAEAVKIAKCPGAVCSMATRRHLSIQLPSWRRATQTARAADSY